MNNVEPQAPTSIDRLTRDIQAADSLSRVFRDYGAVAFLTICYASIALLQGASDAGLFFGVLVIVLSLHSVSEKRADRRHKLLLDALNELGGRGGSTDASKP